MYTSTGRMVQRDQIPTALRSSHFSIGHPSIQWAPNPVSLSIFKFTSAFVSSAVSQEFPNKRQRIAGVQYKKNRRN